MQIRKTSRYLRESENAGKKVIPTLPWALQGEAQQAQSGAAGEIADAREASKQRSMSYALVKEALKSIRA